MFVKGLKRCLNSLLPTACQCCASIIRRSRSKQPLTVMGIETSCDDTAVCVLSSDRKVLSERHHVDRITQFRIGGISPYVCASQRFAEHTYKHINIFQYQHRRFIDKLVDECLEESGVRLCDLDGVAVCARPGLAIALAVGAEKAVRLARNGQIPLIKVHHMQAHATIASFIWPEISYNFIAYLVSGGHCLIVLSKGPDQFEILAEAISSSPGECFDKIARELPPPANSLLASLSGGAVIERLAAESCNGHSRYPLKMPFSRGSSFNFFPIYNSYVEMLKRRNFSVDVNDFCASVQHTIAAYLAKKLHHCLEFLADTNQSETITKTIVLSGGVASNRYIRRCLEKVATFYGYLLFVPPPKFCCDNAEMVAWNGIQLLRQEKNLHVLSIDELPLSVWVDARSPIGSKMTSTLPVRPRKRLSLKSITSERIAFHNSAKDIELRLNNYTIRDQMD